MVKDRFIFKPRPPVECSSITESVTDQSRRREQLKQELQCVIESMGAGSPEVHTNSFDADNESSPDDYTLSLVTTSFESTNVSVKANKATSPLHQFEAGEPCHCLRQVHIAPCCNYCVHHVCHSTATIPPPQICPCASVDWLKNKPLVEKETTTIKPVVDNRKAAPVKEEKIKKSAKFLDNKTNRKKTFFDGNTQRRVDFYYFDHGNAQYFHTTDPHPVLMSEVIAEKTENYTTKFWAEIFGSVHIFFSFATSFLLQFIRFILYSIVRPLTVGLMQLISDYCFKPLLTTLFNAFVQPPLIFLYNVATSLRDLMDPIAEGVGYFFREFAVLFRSIRFCCVKKCECKNCKNGLETCV